MLDQKQAAKFLIVAWCKDWSIAMLARTLRGDPIVVGGDAISGEDIVELASVFKWMPAFRSAYFNGYKVRRFIGAFYPKLSRWLFNQANDMVRLRCACQVEKLVCPEKPAALRSKEEENEMATVRRHNKQMRESYRISREAFQTHQRSAWNVCKA